MNGGSGTGRPSDLEADEAAAVTGGAHRDDLPAEADRIAEGDTAAETGRVHSAATDDAPIGTAEHLDPVSGDVVPGGVADAAASDEETKSSEAPETEFAREEGFVGAGATLPPRRDLGEFEDDDTVPHTPEPEPSGPDPLATSPYRAAPDAESPHRGRGFGSLLGAGLLGAALAVGGGALLLTSGALTIPVAETPAANVQQFATAGEVQQVTGDVATLRGAVEQLQSAQAAGGAGSGMVSTSDFAQLSDRVAAAERAVQSGGASTGDAASAAASATETANAARDTASAAETTANAARDAAAGATTAADGAQSAAQAAQQAAQNAQTAANEARTAVDGFASRLSSIEEANRRAGVALSAASLKTAIDRGTPFMSELETFAGAAGNPEAVQSLRDFAASGVPTPYALTAQWNEAEGAILAALRPADPTAELGSQVLSGLRSLVTVRPAGTAVSSATPGPEAAVARMDAAIAGGDYAAWTSEWTALPDAAKTASQDFADKVKARTQADGIIDQTINSAIGASASQG
ncbi:COG4223 family protein [Aureimonas sp. AU12]|uniref:COG4223 family protein n=1 Tax=Aureimonas sp. AU12 TaxID=1638161 RepID=UPI000A9B64C0|nr:hypothetical protein [Aureimonas sp. AU12]